MERKLTHITSPNRRYLTIKTCIKVVNNYMELNLLLSKYKLLDIVLEFYTD